jgi:hypothetical protein
MRNTVVYILFISAFVVVTSMKEIRTMHGMEHVKLVGSAFQSIRASPLHILK